MQLPRPLLIACGTLYYQRPGTRSYNQDSSQPAAAATASTSASLPCLLSSFHGQPARIPEELAEGIYEPTSLAHGTRMTRVLVAEAHDGKGQQQQQQIKRPEGGGDEDEDGRQGSLLFRILTHNIRYATTSPSAGEQPWSIRAPHIVNELDYHSRLNPESFVCLQEALHNQVTDVLAGLNARPHAQADEWAYYGVGRDDGKQAGEYSPIFYRPAVWTLQERETVWLPETPSVPSKGWDAASIRIVTIGVFNHKASNTTVLAMNTHLDDQGSKSRLESAKLILSLIQKYLARHPEVKGNFLAGDFNSIESQEAYREFTKPGSSIVDTYKKVPAAQHYGDEITFTGFDGKTKGSRIDYVMVGPQSASASIPFTVNGYAVVPNRFDNRIYNSDHRAVVADVTL
ncbi:hypothetical protein H106_03835 [Trichophyton rubrum CBS 735.88]|nr:hypothetical protein H106_03835 [Trichophyton rubrum CBS 735.88]